MASLAIFKNWHLKNFLFIDCVGFLLLLVSFFFFLLVAMSRGYILVAVHKLLVVVASLFVTHGLRCPTACGIFPDQGLNPCPLAGLTTGPPGKSLE